MTRYVVKVRRNYHGREVTSVLCAPTTRDEAEQILRGYVDMYQSTQYYIEEWNEND